MPTRLRILLRHRRAAVDIEPDADPGPSEAVDGTYPANSHQREVFRACEPLIHTCARGCSGAVVTYGAWGSGKSYTLGCLDGRQLAGLDADSGILMRAVVLLFRQHGPGFTVSLQAAEVCDDETIDLLSSRGAFTALQQQRQKQLRGGAGGGGSAGPGAAALDSATAMRASLRKSLKSLLARAGVGGGSDGGGGAARAAPLTRVMAKTTAEALAVLRMAVTNRSTFAAERLPDDLRGRRASGGGNGGGSSRGHAVFQISWAVHSAAPAAPAPTATAAPLPPHRLPNVPGNGPNLVDLWWSAVEATGGDESDDSAGLPPLLPADGGGREGDGSGTGSLAFVDLAASSPLLAAREAASLQKGLTALCRALATGPQQQHTLPSPGGTDAGGAGHSHQARQADAPAMEGAAAGAATTRLLGLLTGGALDHVVFIACLAGGSSTFADRATMRTVRQLRPDASSPPPPAVAKAVAAAPVRRLPPPMLSMTPPASPRVPAGGGIGGMSPAPGGGGGGGGGGGSRKVRGGSLRALLRSITTSFSSSKALDIPDAAATEAEADGSAGYMLSLGLAPPTKHRRLTSASSMGGPWPVSSQRGSAAGSVLDSAGVTVSPSTAAAAAATAAAEGRSLASFGVLPGGPSATLRAAPFAPASRRTTGRLSSSQSNDTPDSRGEASPPPPPAAPTSAPLRAHLLLLQQQAASLATMTAPRPPLLALPSPARSAVGSPLTTTYPRLYFQPAPAAPVHAAAVAPPPRAAALLLPSLPHVTRQPLQQAPAFSAAPRHGVPAGTAHSVTTWAAAAATGAATAARQPLSTVASPTQSPRHLVALQALAAGRDASRTQVGRGAAALSQAGAAAKGAAAPSAADVSALPWLGQHAAKAAAAPKDRPTSVSSTAGVVAARGQPVAAAAAAAAGARPVAVQTVSRLLQAHPWGGPPSRLPATRRPSAGAVKPPLSPSRARPAAALAPPPLPLMRFRERGGRSPSPQGPAGRRLEGGQRSAGVRRSRSVLPLHLGRGAAGGGVAADAAVLCGPHAQSLQTQYRQLRDDFQRFLAFTAAATGRLAPMPRRSSTLGAGPSSALPSIPEPAPTPASAPAAGSSSAAAAATATQATPRLHGLGVAGGLTRRPTALHIGRGHDAVAIISPAAALTAFAASPISRVRVPPSTSGSAPVFRTDLASPTNLRGTGPRAAAAAAAASGVTAVQKPRWGSGGGGAPASPSSAYSSPLGRAKAAVAVYRSPAHATTPRSPAPAPTAASTSTHTTPAHDAGRAGGLMRGASDAMTPRSPLSAGTSASRRAGGGAAFSEGGSGAGPAAVAVAGGPKRPVRRTLLQPPAGAGASDRRTVSSPGSPASAIAHPLRPAAAAAAAIVAPHPMTARAAARPPPAVEPSAASAAAPAAGGTDSPAGWTASGPGSGTGGRQLHSGTAAALSILASPAAAGLPTSPSSPPAPGLSTSPASAEFHHMLDEWDDAEMAQGASRLLLHLNAGAEAGGAAGGGPDDLLWSFDPPVGTPPRRSCCTPDLAPRGSPSRPDQGELPSANARSSSAVLAAGSRFKGSNLLAMGGQSPRKLEVAAAAAAAAAAGDESEEEDDIGFVLRPPNMLAWAAAAAAAAAADRGGGAPLAKPLPAAAAAGAAACGPVHQATATPLPQGPPSHFVCFTPTSGPAPSPNSHALRPTTSCSNLSDWLDDDADVQMRSMPTSPSPSLLRSPTDGGDADAAGAASGGGGGGGARSPTSCAASRSSRGGAPPLQPPQPGTPSSATRRGGSPQAPAAGATAGPAPASPPLARSLSPLLRARGGRGGDGAQKASQLPHCSAKVAGALRSIAVVVARPAPAVVPAATAARRHTAATPALQWPAGGISTCVVTARTRGLAFGSKGGGSPGGKGRVAGGGGGVAGSMSPRSLAAAASEVIKPGSVSALVAGWPPGPSPAGP